jgi:hypothetical protein
MRKAIDSGKPAKKRGALPEKTKDVRIPPKRTAKSAEKQQEDKKDASGAKSAARSITRGGNGAPKPVRAPKVSRVAVPQTPKAEQAAEPDGEDWLDELLDNLSERDKQGYVKADTPAETPVKAEAKEQPVTTRPEPLPETGKQPQKPQRPPEVPKTRQAAQTAKPQTTTDAPKPSAPPAPTKTEATAQTAKPQPSGQTDGEQQGTKPMGPRQEESSTEEAIRSFEETLRTLGGRTRPETEQKPDDHQAANNAATEAQAHRPKHAATTEDEKR